MPKSIGTRSEFILAIALFAAAPAAASTRQITPIGGWHASPFTSLPNSPLGDVETIRASQPDVEIHIYPAHGFLARHLK